MFTVAIDITPLSSAHQGRGVGTYSRGLVEALKATPPSNFSFEFIANPDSITVDLYHYPYFDLFFPTLVSKNKPFIVTVHDVIPLRYPHYFPSGIKGKFNYHRQTHALRQSAAVITDSQASKQDIHQYLHIPLSQIHVVYLAASPVFKPLTTSAITSFKAKNHLPNKFFAYVGDINYNKNLPLLINSINDLDMPLVIVTRSKLDTSIAEKQTSMAISAINSALNNLSSKNKVRFLDLPDADSLNLLYNAATWYIQPSLAEGFGLPLLEAMQAGTPIIAAEASSLPEVAGSAALYFDPTSEASIVTTLRQAESTSSASLKDHSKSSLNQAAKFTWAKTAASTINVYKSVLSCT